MAESRERGLPEVRRWDPFRELAPWAAFPDFGGGSRLQRLFDEAFGDGPRMAQRAPAVDVTETGEKYVVTAELPGVRREDLTVEVHDGVLHLRGEKRSEREEKGEKSRWLERTFGSFSRSFTLPADADDTHIEASFRDGVLTVELAKRPEAKPRTIAVRT
jgi:HSP20 family protein